MTQDTHTVQHGVLEQNRDSSIKGYQDKEKDILKTTNTHQRKQDREEGTKNILANDKIKRRGVSTRVID